MLSRQLFLQSTYRTSLAPPFPPTHTCTHARMLAPTHPHNPPSPPPHTHTDTLLLDGAHVTRVQCSEGSQGRQWQILIGWCLAHKSPQVPGRHDVQCCTVVVLLMQGGLSVAWVRRFIAWSCHSPLGHCTGEIGPWLWSAFCDCSFFFFLPPDTLRVLGPAALALF